MTEVEVDEIFDSTPDLSKASDQEIAEELQKRGFQVQLEKGIGGGVARIPEVKDKQTFKFAVASDPHLGSKNQQLTALRRFYRYAKRQKCAFALNPGDFTEGSSKMHRDAVYGIFVHGADAQVDYAAQVYPDDLKTYGITGNHDLSHWADGGTNVVKRLSEVRDDIEHVGDNGAFLQLSALKVYLWHPKGGTAYARSYKPARFIDDLQPVNRPHILLTGHFHTANHSPQQGGVEAFMVPCFKGIANDLYLKALGKSPIVGGLICEVGLDDNGNIHRLRTEWVITPASDWKRDDF